MSLYLDYAATTPLDSRVLDKMIPYLKEFSLCGNASSSHYFGKVIKDAIEDARINVGNFLNVDNSEIFWTSGATESNNLAIKGIYEARKSKGMHIITSAVEHKSILQTCLHLQTHQGAEVTFIRPDSNGSIDPQKVKEAIREDTILISIMHVNNEVGTIQDISEIGKIANQNKIIFHVDAAQSLGKAKLSIKDWGVDLLSLSAHKAYGPKGVGCLFIKDPANLAIKCQIHGGGQEKSLRSGTLATHQIIGMGECLSLLKREEDDNISNAKNLAQFFENQLEHIEGVTINGDRNKCVSSIFNISFDFVDSGMLLEALPDIAIANGSACTSEKITSSHVLQAMGLGRDVSRGAVRISFGKYTSKNDLDFAVEKISKAVSVLRQKSSLWNLSRKINW